jgi:citrate lyase subunit beta/citryl-CoA lyase
MRLTSLLFVPADSAKRSSTKAKAVGADGLILDLEDSVAPSNKAAARGQWQAGSTAADIRPATGRSGCGSIRLTPGLTADDLKAVVRPGLDGIVLPKANGGAGHCGAIAAMIDPLEAGGRHGARER